MARRNQRAAIFEPQDLLAKPAALVPVPRVHVVRFHGILGPAAAWRSLIIPTAPASGVESAPDQCVASAESVDVAAGCAERKPGADAAPIIRGLNDEACFRDRRFTVRPMRRRDADHRRNSTAGHHAEDSGLYRPPKPGAASRAGCARTHRLLRSVLTSNPADIVGVFISPCVRLISCACPACSLRGPAYLHRTACRVTRNLISRDRPQLDPRPHPAYSSCPLTHCT